MEGTANTKVTLRLNRTAAPAGRDFERELQAFLHRTVVRTPCAMNVILEGCVLNFPAGWAPERPPKVSAQVISPRPDRLFLTRLPTTSLTLDMVTALTTIREADLAQAGVHIEADFQEYHLPGLATLRCTAPFISYRGIRAMVWATDADPDIPDGRFTMVGLSRISRTAWRGMHCRLMGAAIPGLRVEPPDFLPQLRCRVVRSFVRDISPPARRTGWKHAGACFAPSSAPAGAPWHIPPTRFPS